MEPLKATRSDYNWVSCLLLGILADPLREAIMIIMRDAAPACWALKCDISCSWREARNCDETDESLC